MFPRQWFSGTSQIGLEQSALDFEAHLNRSDLEKASGIALLESRIYPKYWARQYKRLLHLERRKFEILQGNYRHIRVYMAGFWPTMNPFDCQLLDYLEAAADGVELKVVNNPADADISLYSCYGNHADLRQTDHTARILFLGENVRPSFTDFDLSLSFDLCEYGGRNIHLPLWMLEIDWFDKSYPDRTPFKISSFTQSRKIDAFSRSNSIVHIGNNREPFRAYLLQALLANGIEVDTFGIHSNPVADKFELCKSYKISLCPENSFYPGYVTEKLLHSFVSGASSIYWGGMDHLPFARHPSILRVSTSDPIDLIVSRVKGIFLSEEAFPCPPLFSYDWAILCQQKVVAKLHCFLRQFNLI